MPSAAAQPTPKRASIRWRLILGVMALLVVTLTLVGLLLYTAMRGHFLERVAEEQDRVAREFAVLATEGVDPQTGAPFTEPGPLLEVMLLRTALAPSEGILGLVDGERPWTAAEGVTLRPEEDPELLTHVGRLASDTQISSGLLTTSVSEYHYTVAPVRFTGTGEGGALVFVTDMRAERWPLNQMMLDYVWASLACLVLASAVVAFWVRRLLKPISWLRDTAERISDADLSERVSIEGGDELADLAATMNQMLDRIESGLSAQRALLDDVGHELRTPVTIVRGHLELMDAHDPADVEGVRSIAIDELDRMGGLVTDLLTLAKSGQPDFLAPRPTELAALTDAVLTKARALDDRTWVMSRVADVVAVLDPDRITQAWLQLAANAVKYSDPSTPIQIGSRESLGECYLWVADRGIGIAHDDLDVVRSRFGRAEGVRGSIEGTGLGLNIVDSIARAHGGRLDIDSTPGVGSTFTIVIPLAPQTGAP